MFIVKIIENNTMYNMQELQLFLFSLTILTSSKFYYILLLIYQLIFFYICNFYNQHIHQHHVIYHIHTHSYLDSKYILYHIHLYQLILQISINIYHHPNVVYCYKNLHLIYIYTYKFHAILCVLFHQFIRLRALTFKSSTTLGTHISTHFLINPNILLYYIILFHQTLMNF